MDKLKEYGWIALKSHAKSPIEPKKEALYFLKRYFIDLMAFPFLLLIPLVMFFKKSSKTKRKKVLFGTHPIVSNMFLREIVKSDFETELFVFKDWSPGHHNGLVLDDIAPKWMYTKDPYIIGSYYAFFRALVKFDIFVLYFDSGFLERTLWWRLEPIIYRLFNKKILIYPYGADVWNSMLNFDLKRKFGHMYAYEKYFNLDFKRIKRAYWWSKYANIIVGSINYIYWLPRVDYVVWHGQVNPNIEKKEFSYPSVTEKIKILHYANEGYRKGSHAIKRTLLELSQKRSDCDVSIAEGLNRDDAIRLLDGAHIYIDNLIDGFMSFSSLEAMVKGKVVVTNINSEVDEFYTYLNPEYYESFFRDLPIIRADAFNLKAVITELLDNKSELESIAKRSMEFANRIFAENDKAWKLIFSQLEDDC